MVQNLAKESVTFLPGEYLAQLLINLAVNPSIENVSRLDILSDRQHQAFGSSDEQLNLIGSLNEQSCVNVNNVQTYCKLDSERIELIDSKNPFP